MMYNELVLDCFFHPQHAGVTDSGDIIMVQTKNMALYVIVESNEKIRKAGFRSSANPYKIAGLEWICRNLEGNLPFEYPKMDARMLADILGIPVLQYADAIALEGLYKRLMAELAKRG